MARSKFRPKFRGFSKEETSWRRETMRQWKAKSRQAVRSQNWDALPIPKKGTEGWETW